MAAYRMSPGILESRNTPPDSSPKSSFSANTGCETYSTDSFSLPPAMSAFKSVANTSVKPAPTSLLTNIPPRRIPETPSQQEKHEKVGGKFLNSPTFASGTAPDPSISELNHRSSDSPIPGFSQAQTAHIYSYIKSQVAKEMQHQRTKMLESLDQNALQNEELMSMLAKNLNVTPRAPQRAQEDDNSGAFMPTPQPTAQCAQASTEFLTEIRPQDIGYFYPDYQSEKEDASPVPSVGKYVYFRDVYMFVNWLKDFAARSKDVKNVISSCLRGSALIWYLVELSEEGRVRLRTSAGLDEWYELLINRFKLDASIAEARLMSSSSVYTLAAVKHTPPCEWAQYMLQLARATNFASTYCQLSMLWNQLDPELRHSIRMPTEQTTLSEFLEQIDRMASVWYEMAHRRSSHTRSQQPTRPSQSQQQYRIYYGKRYLQNYPINDRLQEVQSSGVAPDYGGWCHEAEDQGTYEENNYGWAYAF